MHGDIKLAIIGLGYVGLPLAVAFSQHYPTLGFDTNPARIDELKAHKDSTLETSKAELKAAKNLSFSADVASLKSANIYIIAVPTPVDTNNLPDLTPLQTASQTIASILKKGDIVVYESTVYPGATEDICAKILSQISGLVLNEDYFLGYSPERINPGDKVNTLTNITKVVAASNQQTEQTLNTIYKKIIKAGVFVAASIKVAEAAKAVENTQRDINIAFMNELAMMFNHMHIDTLDVIAAASTKWNFLPFKPGLVGGHCIGVDPYYLIHKSQESGYYPQLINTARRLNEKMSQYVVQRFLRKLALSKIHVVAANILILGITFKENCPDLRNTRVTEIITELQNCHANIDVYDPWADAEMTKKYYAIDLQKDLKNKHYDAVLLAVAHDEFKQMGSVSIRQLLKEKGIIFDIKGLFGKQEVDERL